MKTLARLTQKLLYKTVFCKPYHTPSGRYVAVRLWYVNLMERSPKRIAGAIDEARVMLDEWSYGASK